MTEKFTCAFCGNLAPDGLRIHGELVCPACENRLLKVAPHDRDYDEWLAGVRDLWSKWSQESKA